jgi:hypothetical protein
MAEQVVERFALDRDFQLPGVGPVQLEQLARVAILRKEHLPLRALGRPPVAHPPKKGAQMTFLQPAVRSSQKIFEQGFGFQLRRIPQHPGDLLPNLIQRIGTCPPRVLGLQFAQALARLNVFACGVTIHVRLHRAVRYLACLFVFVHEPFVLLFGNHLAAAWNQTGHTANPPNRRSILPAHWGILIGITGES